MRHLLSPCICPIICMSHRDNFFESCLTRTYIYIYIYIYRVQLMYALRVRAYINKSVFGKILSEI